MSDQKLQGLKHHIDGIAAMSHEAWTELEGIVQVFEIGNEELLVKEGGIASSEVYLASGILRAYYHSSEGEEVNVAFYTENNILPPHYFRTKDNRSDLNIQALSKSVVLEFNAGQFTSLRLKHSSLLKYGNIIVERELQYKTQREILLLTKSAEGRYRIFREFYPGLENRISQYHIASYLGITPVSLSRIRKSMAKN